MKVISFSSIKGGTGKSSLCILTANYAAAAGYRVLAIDLDLQNSLTSYYMDEADLLDRRNVAQALLHDCIKENTVTTNYMGVELLASSFDLIKLRSLSEKTLARVLPEVSEAYDFCFIDTAPTCDNLVLNALMASDLILSPVQFSQFDYKAARFFRDQLERDTDKLGLWKILFNFYKPSRSDNPNTVRNQYESMFRDTFGDSIAPVRIPDSALVSRSIDTKEKITDAAAKTALHAAVGDLARYCGVGTQAGGF